MRPPEGLTFERVESGDPNCAAWKVTAPSIIHRCPPPGQGITPCCERTPFELPRWHRMTLDDALVTCGYPPISARGTTDG